MKGPGTDSSIGQLFFGYTRADGELYFNDLKPGLYTMEASPFGNLQGEGTARKWYYPSGFKETDAGPIEIVAGKELKLDFFLSETGGGSLEIHVSDSRGEPVGGAVIDLW